MSHPRHTFKTALEQYSHSSVRLAALLKHGHALSEEERLAVENHILIVQLALAVSTHISKRPASSRHE